MRGNRLPQRLGRLLILCGLVAAWTLNLNAAELPFAQGLLFQIERGGDPVGYLFGTIHSEDKRVLVLPEPVEQAFIHSSKLYVEVDMGATNLLSSMAGMLLDDGRVIADILEPELYRETVTAAAKLGLPEVALQHYKPWVLAMLLSLPPSETGQFLDLVLYQRAQSLNMEVAGLETVREQLDLFDTLPEEDQVMLLRDALNNLESLPTVYKTLLDHYLKRDLQGLVDINERLSAGSDKALAERLQTKAVDERNQRMIKRLLVSLKKGGVFVAVGALHLPGEHGMLRLLEKRGYRIVRKY